MDEESELEQLVKEIGGYEEQTRHAELVRVVVLVIALSGLGCFIWGIKECNKESEAVYQACKYNQSYECFRSAREAYRQNH
jgi:hypothetical protein|nr:MAG TPA: Cytochrome oxidase maturation protein cbb3-type [Caudoviricetes sp.]